MHPVAEKFSVVVIGAWNVAVFSPQWVSTHLTTQKEIIIEVPLASLVSSLRLSFEDIYLYISADRLMLVPQRAIDPSLTRLHEIAKKVLNDLPHTPVIAVGINFHYHETSPSGRLLDSFVLPDQGYLADCGASIKEISIRRSLKIHDRDLNLTIEYNHNANVDIDFNFHKDVESAEAASRYLNLVDILTLRRESLNLLDEAYEVTSNDVE